MTFYQMTDKLRDPYSLCLLASMTEVAPSTEQGNLFKTSVEGRYHSFGNFVDLIKAHLRP